MRLSSLFETVKQNMVLIERDVVNAAETKTWVTAAAERISNSTAKTWFRSQLYDYLINQTTDREMVKMVDQSMITDQSPEWLVTKIQQGDQVFQITTNSTFEQQVGSVRDWVSNWIEENPNARINFTWDQAIKATKRWHAELAQGASHGEEEITDVGLAIFHDATGDYKWVDVQSTVCLKREGGRMGHCVGSYGPQVARGDLKILSLRSGKNSPHVTIEVSEPPLEMWAYHANQRSGSDQIDFELEPSHGTTYGTIQQIKGKENRPPVPKYIPYVKDLMDNHKFDVSPSGEYDLKSIGYYYRDGKLLSLKDVGRVIIKNPGGTKWVGVKRSDTDMYGRGWGEAILVNAAWTPILTMHISENEGNFSIDGGSGSSQYGPELLNLGTKMTLDQLPADDLLGFELACGEGGINTPLLAAGSQRTTLPNGDEILKLRSYMEMYTTASSAKFILAIARNDTIIGHVDVSQAGRILRVVSRSGTPIVDDYRTYIMNISEAIGLKIDDGVREALLIDQHNAGTDLDDFTTHIGGRYPSYHEHTDGGLIYVMMGEDYPIAVVNINDDDGFEDITSVVYDQQKIDHGLMGFILIDLYENNHISFDEESFERLLAEKYLWGKYNNEFYFTDFLYYVTHRRKTSTEIAGRGSEDVVDEGVGFNDFVDEVFGGDDEHTQAAMAGYISVGHYSSESPSYDGDDEEGWAEIFVTIEADGDSKRAASYDGYNFDKMVELQRLSKDRD